MAAPFARNVLLATRARLAPAVAARAASTLSTSAFGGSFAQSPAIMMMALDRAPAQTVVGAFYLPGNERSLCSDVCTPTASERTVAMLMHICVRYAVLFILCRAVREPLADL